MVGDFETTEYEELIKNQARQLGVYERIKWIGFTDDVYSELKKMSVFVLPSLYGEGMPMVVLEAMALGMPIVATQVGGIEELIYHGKHGLLVKPGDSKALCDAVESILNGHVDGSILGNNARQRQIDNFSDYAMAKGVAGAYDEILSA